MAKQWPEMVIKLPFVSHNFPGFSLQNCKKSKARKNLFYVVDFDPIKIFISWAIQNDLQNLSFVKAINVVGKKMARNGCKIAIYYCYLFRL